MRIFLYFYILVVNNLSAQNNFTNKRLSREMLELTNMYRKKNNKEPLKLNDIISRIANKHAKYMCSANKLTHESPEGKLKTRLINMGFEAKTVGENIAQQENNDYEELARLWMNSKLHRNNILGNFDYTDVATCRNSNNRYWIQIFGKEDSKPADDDLLDPQNKNNIANISSLKKYDESQPEKSVVIKSAGAQNPIKSIENSIDIVKRSLDTIESCLMDAMCSVLPSISIDYSSVPKDSSKIKEIEPMTEKTLQLTKSMISSVESRTSPPITVTLYQTLTLTTSDIKNITVTKTREKISRYTLTSTSNISITTTKTVKITTFTTIVSTFLSTVTSNATITYTRPPMISIIPSPASTVTSLMAYSITTTLPEKTIFIKTSTPRDIVTIKKIVSTSTMEPRAIESDENRFVFSKYKINAIEDMNINKKYDDGKKNIIPNINICLGSQKCSNIEDESTSGIDSHTMTENDSNSDPNEMDIDDLMFFTKPRDIRRRKKRYKPTQVKNLRRKQLKKWKPHKHNKKKTHIYSSDSVEFNNLYEAPDDRIHSYDHRNKTDNSYNIIKNLLQMINRFQNKESKEIFMNNNKKHELSILLKNLLQPIKKRIILEPPQYDDNLENHPRKQVLTNVEKKFIKLPEREVGNKPEIHRRVNYSPIINDMNSEINLDNNVDQIHRPVNSNINLIENKFGSVASPVVKHNSPMNILDSKNDVMHTPPVVEQNLVVNNLENELKLDSNSAREPIERLDYLNGLMELQPHHNNDMLTEDEEIFIKKNLCLLSNTCDTRNESVYYKDLNNVSNLRTEMQSFLKNFENNNTKDKLEIAKPLFID